MKFLEGRIKNSREFEKARNLSALLSSSRMKQDNPMLGRLGIDNPKFEGYYVTPAGEFPSCHSAALANGIGKSTIQRRCKNPDKIVTATKVGKLSMGKTWRELGYWFKEV